MENLDRLDSALSEDVWTTVNGNLLRKVLAEFMYEDVVTPAATTTVPAGDDEPGESWTRYHLTLTDGIEYRFEAQRRPLDSYRIREGSVHRRDDGTEWHSAGDPIQFFLDAREYIGVDPTTAAHLVREYNNTLVADAHIRARKNQCEAASILDFPYAEVEGEMEGHPWYTYNKGRIGFGYDDYLQYAPESKEPQRLSWVAVSRERGTFQSVEGLEHTALIADELGEYYEQFREQLLDRGLDPAAYLFLPVHDWQWNDSIVQLFAGDIATDAIVPLGKGPDEYLPQQSIRTFSNTTTPEKHHVKLPIRVLNTNVYRGILGEQAEAAPGVTAFIKSVRDNDTFLRDDCELLLPGEIASINYEHPLFSQFDDAPYQYHELLGCVWRESVLSLIDDDERPLTLAALLHEDFDGTPIATRLADRAGLELTAWIDEFLEVLLNPLLHYLYKYGLVFMPHGTNVVLIHDDGRPTRIAVKDFVDEVAITDRDFPELAAALPDELRDDDRYKHHILHQIPPESLCHRMVGTLFVGVFRYVADLLARHHDYPEERFWGQVRSAMDAYQSRFPEFEDRFSLFDLYQPRFKKYCLNRNRMVRHGYEDTSTRPDVATHGSVSNPLHNLNGK
ncbi:siderophore synthetase component [Halogeometricum borinquense DSM 11551]|uniref:Siderophore synthetase component n=1 Tax=Halogeometricum borinquense (strain ATCC 700274 / DSM 11551 / JCM 10706 / KCTC 4070 / PR3) TaxID=469382 RepID=E4NVT1_HALBP|nr:IucA/IucC family siderophore biosynthesis protein [Halogeometricum borinquense]ADQ69151.1 siderophore synthetase component [Halogeometricum borinquense DSM 11551]ELY31823.1 siderophore synthetase component [Halogeometricum borinquense DSM 11551]